MYTGCLPWQKLMQKIAMLADGQWQIFLFVFVVHGADSRRATYLCLDCAMNMDKNRNITVSFIIHVNFDHAWAEHYPVTLSATFMLLSIYMYIYRRSSRCASVWLIY